MCSQCSFQIALRSLRFKTPKHAAYGSRRVAFNASNRLYSTAALTQAINSPTLSSTKPLSFTLPSLQSLSQSYSQWSNSPPPHHPTPFEILQQGDPFASSEGISDLFSSMAHNDACWWEFEKIIFPVLSSLLSIRHYAGARAVLERTLESISNMDLYYLPLGRKRVNTLISTLFGTAVYHPNQSKQLHNIPAMQSMLNLLLRHLVAEPKRYQIRPIIVKNLLSIPEYVSLNSVVLILELFERVAKEDLHPEQLTRSLPTLHNIMRVYALHGKLEEVQHWMEAIAEVSQSLRISKSQKDEAKLPASTSASASVPAEYSNTTFKPLAIYSSKPIKQVAQASTAMHLGTTYLSALAQRPFGSETSPNIDSSAAMAFFQELWHQSSSSDIDLSDKSKGLDIYAWSAILQAAAVDRRKISSHALVRVLHTLQDHPDLPDPNIVAYTTVMGGMNMRGEYAQTIELFEQEVLPKAVQSLNQGASGTIGDNVPFRLDAQALGAVIDAHAGLGNLHRAAEIMKWFGSRQQSQMEDGNMLGSAEEAGSTVHNAKAVVGQTYLGALYDTLRGTVAIDTQLVNRLITHMGRNNHFNSVYNIFNSMQELYGVSPDDVTLVILARTALTAGKAKRKGLIPDFSEDLWPSRSRTAASNSTQGFYDTSHQRRNNPGDIMENGVWDGREPVTFVLDMYWTMLEQNFDAAHEEAVRNTMQSTASSFFSFGKKLASFSSPSSKDLIETDAASEAIVERYHYTSSFSKASGKQRFQYTWPSVVPSGPNMHMLIALSGYFGRGSDIPLILSHMRCLNIRPSHRTLCLAIWTFEETGVYTSELRKLRDWLSDWPGLDNVPSDEEIGHFRTKQWGRSGGR